MVKLLATQYIPNDESNEWRVGLFDTQSLDWTPRFTVTKSLESNSLPDLNRVIVSPPGKPHAKIVAVYRMDGTFWLQIDDRKWNFLSQDIICEQFNCLNPTKRGFRIKNGGRVEYTCLYTKVWISVPSLVLKEFRSDPMAFNETDYDPWSYLVDIEFKSISGNQPDQYLNNFQKNADSFFKQFPEFAEYNKHVK